MKVFGIWSKRQDQPEEDQWVAVVEIDESLPSAMQDLAVARVLLGAYETHEKLGQPEGRYTFYASQKVPPHYRDEATDVLFLRNGKPVSTRGSMYPATEPDIADLPPRPE
jgi:hypothetical protein